MSVAQRTRLWDYREGNGMMKEENEACPIFDITGRLVIFVSDFLTPALPSTAQR
jgi:hypothetical protein